MPPALELLIHISAPSRGSDDARYRKQALGFWEFEAVRRHDVLERDGKAHERGVVGGGVVGVEDAGAVGQQRGPLRGGYDEGEGGDIILRLAGGLGSQEARRIGVQEVPATAILPAERAWTESTVEATTPRSANSRLPRSSLSISPVARTHTPPLALEGAIISQSASRTAVQVIPATAIPPVEPAWTSSTVSATSPSTHSGPRQSFPSASPAPRLHIPQTPFPSRPVTAPTAFSKPHSPQPVRRSQSDSWETPPSVVPDSQPSVRFHQHSVPSSEIPLHSSSERISQPSSPPAKRRRLTTPTNVLSSTPSSSQPSPPPRPPSPPLPPRCSSRSHFQSPSTKRRPTRPTSSPANASLPPPPPPSSPLHQPPPSPVPPNSPPSALSLHNPISTPIPAPPPTALAPFTTHITPSLSLIASQLPLSKFFRPVHTARTLRVLERGCWVLDLGKSGTADQSECEKLAAGEMGAREGERGRGRAVGNGVQKRQRTWRPHFLAYLTHFLASGRAGWGVWLESSPSASASPGGTVRIHCWGEVVAHVWLLLFLASERNVRGLGARWVDGGGEVVVRMV